MSYLKSRSLVAAIALVFTSPLLAGDDPVHERHEMMEGVGDAAKPIGEILKGERDFCWKSAGFCCQVPANPALPC